jgi:hypothetical protein
MFRLAPLVAFGVATVFVGYSAMQFSYVSSVITAPKEDAPSTVPPTLPIAPPLTARSNEPGLNLLVRCLSDIDDLLDTIHDPAGFEAVKPKILDRMRLHVAQGSALRNQGMKKLSKAEAKEMEKATNRHMTSLSRADQVAPGIVPFFQKEVGAILSGQ